MRNFENKEKIKKISGVMQFICGWVALGSLGQCVLIVLWPIVYVIRHHYSSTPSNPDIHSTFWFWFKLPFGALEGIAWMNLWKFFGGLKAGRIFDAPMVRRLATAGKLMLAGAVYLYVFEFILFLVEIPTANGPVQLGDATGALVGNLTAAMAIILAAWLLREGQTLEEEQNLTV